MNYLHLNYKKPNRTTDTHDINLPNKRQRNAKPRSTNTTYNKCPQGSKEEKLAWMKKRQIERKLAGKKRVNTTNKGT